MQRKHGLISLIVFIILLGQGSSVSALGAKYPQLGEKFPNYTFRDIENFTGRQIDSVSTIHRNGKWLVLDLWDIGCTGCIQSMPHLSELSAEFSDKVQFACLGYTGSRFGDKSPKYNYIHGIFAKICQKYHLNLSCAFDSAFFDKYQIRVFPCVFIIDPTGTLRANTRGIDKDYIARILSGDYPIANQYNEVKTQYNTGIPFLAYSNGGADTAFLFRSLLAKWKPGMEEFRPSVQIESIADIIDPKDKNRIELLKTDINTLYRYAYLGRDGFQHSKDPEYLTFWKQLIIETIDSGRFHLNLEQTRNNVRSDAEEYYCYSLSLSPQKASRNAFMVAMQCDLLNYFGYNVVVETRNMPCWEIVSLNDSIRGSLQTKGGVPSLKTTNFDGYKFTNAPISSLISKLDYSFPYEPPFIDATGIKGNIDLNVKALVTDFDEVRASLEKSGILLLSSIRPMKVIIIKDPVQ